MQKTLNQSGVNQQRKLFPSTRIIVAHLPALFFEVLGGPKHLFHGPGNHSLFIVVRSVPLHGISFSRACLSISEYTDIVTVQSWLDQLRYFTEHVLLACRRSKYLIEVEFVFRCGFFGSANTLWNDKNQKWVFEAYILRTMKIQSGFVTPWSILNYLKYFEFAVSSFAQTPMDDGCQLELASLLPGSLLGYRASKKRTRKAVWGEIVPLAPFA